MYGVTYKAVVFDYGGTLTEPYRDAMIRFSAERPHLDLRLLRDVLQPLQSGAEGSIVVRCERGEATLEELVDHLEELAPGGGDLFRPDTTPLIGLGRNADMHRLLADVRAAGLRTAVLSNIFTGLHALYDVDAEDFDALVYSCEVGMRKPQPEIYRHVTDLLGVQPEEALFLDDFAAMCEGARAVGMTAVLVADHATAAAQARELLGLAAAEAVH